MDRDARRESRACAPGSRPERLHEYSRVLSRLLKTSHRQLDPSKLRIDEVIPKHAMGDGNSIYDLQNYVLGKDQGVKESGSQGAGFRRVDYFELLRG